MSKKKLNFFVIWGVTYNERIPDSGIMEEEPLGAFDTITAAMDRMSEIVTVWPQEYWLVGVKPNYYIEEEWVTVTSEDDVDQWVAAWENGEIFSPKAA